MNNPQFLDISVTLEELRAWGIAPDLPKLGFLATNEADRLLQKPSTKHKICRSYSTPG